MSDTLRKKLKQAEDDAAELRNERADKVKARDTALTAFEGTEGFDMSSKEWQSLEAATKDVGEVDEKLETLKSAREQMLKVLSQNGNSAQPSIPGLEKDANKSDDDVVKNMFTPEIVKQMAKVANSRAGVGEIALGELVSADTFKAALAGTANMRRGPFYGPVSVARRGLSVLDLIPTGTMNSNSVPYVQEGGSYTAVEVGEGLAKPEAGITLTDALATAATIAHWKKIQKQTLADSDFVQSIVESHLTYGVMRRLEGQVINGDGTGVNMTGIFNTAGIQTQTFAAGALVADQVLRGITKVLVAEGVADGIVVSPGDYQSILIAKAQNTGGTVGSMEYLAGGPFGTVSSTLWGVPVVASPALADGNALVGDFGLGAQLFIRQGVEVLMSDSDQDDFIKNLVTLLAECRAALAVWRPAQFVKVATA